MGERAAKRGVSPAREVGLSQSGVVLVLVFALTSAFVLAKSASSMTQGINWA
jgi:hypothetical protein